MTQEEIKKLAEKIVLGSATEEEIVQYNRICGFIEASTGDAIPISEAEKEALGAALKKAILQKAAAPRVYKMNRRLWAAAAAIVIFLAGMGYIYLQSTGTPKPPIVDKSPENRFKNDVAPGRQGAILTLSNGQQIVLDSASNGALATDGGAQVIKKDGEILYNAGQSTNEVVYNTTRTPFGRQYQLRLSDGTEVWLNAGSSITYPTVFTGKQRTVKITGEVYFEVAHNKNMPFWVGKGDVKVQVLGTHFNMNTYDNERSLKVTLLQGAVRVINRDTEQTLRPGQQAGVTEGKITVAGNVNIEEVMAWKNGRFHFSGANIEQLMRQLMRWYNVEVEYKGKVNELFYAEGLPLDTPLSDVLKALEATGKVHFAIEGNKVIVNAER